MVPLLDRKTYTALKRRHAAMQRRGLPRLAAPFLPIGPDGTASAPMRLLFVGQATRGRFYKKLKPMYAEAAKVSEKTVYGYLAAPSTPFWSMVRNIAVQSLHTIGAASGQMELKRIVGYSNLAKIGALDGNPSESMMDAQKDLCIRALGEEIARMQPTATVIMTGDYAADTVFYPTFGASSTWKYPKQFGEPFVVAWKDHPRFGKLFWTWHPETCRLEKIEQTVTEYIVREIAKLVRKKA